VDDGDRVSEITLHPVALGFGTARSRRGLPELTDDPAILPHLAGLSARYGTQIDATGGIGRVVLPH